MACRGCGEDPKITKAQAELLVERALKALNFADEAKIKEIIDAMKAKGELSDGLQDCEGNDIAKENKLVLCSKLAKLIKSLVDKGELPFVTDLAVNGTTMTWKDGGQVKTYDLKGAKGDKGADGKSAYQQWLAAGHTGTATDFLNAIKGARGEKGATGERGPKGDNAKILAGKGIVKTGDTLSLDVNKSLTFNGNKLDVKIGKGLKRTADGTIEVVPPGCHKISNFNTMEGLPSGDGVFCIYNDRASIGQPMWANGNKNTTQPRANDLTAEGVQADYDWNGWAIRAGRQLTVYMNGGSATWSSVNDADTANGEPLKLADWSDWTQVDGEKAPAFSSNSATGTQEAFDVDLGNGFHMVGGIAEITISENNEGYVIVRPPFISLLSVQATAIDIPIVAGEGAHVQIMKANEIRIYGHTAKAYTGKIKVNWLAMGIKG